MKIAIYSYIMPKKYTELYAKKIRLLKTASNTAVLLSLTSRYTYA